MTLREQIEQDLGLPVGEPTIVRLAVTGEPYVSITHGGVKEEGESCGVWCEYKKVAENLLLCAIREYARTVVGGNPEGFTLYWREDPEASLWSESTFYVPEFSGGKFRYYLRPCEAWGGFARILISDRPAMENAA